MCAMEFTMTEKPVRDHCHMTGKYRAALCRKCNFKRQNQDFFPIFFHNSSNYDSHFIIQLGCDTQNIDIIPNSTEKFISFSKLTDNGVQIRFLDSFKFLGCSLSKLAENIPSDQFHHVSRYFQNNDLHLVTKKGVFPYEYVDSWERLEEQSLPSIDNFLVN